MPDIKPDSPPGEPFEVSVSPDPPPRAPFPVDVFPDAPPREPFDVPIAPDGPGPGTFDVAVFPDMPPREPFGVDVRPDDPPREPLDVPIDPDSPPRTPVAVDLSPDAAPRDPFEVPTSPDSLPREPVDVDVSPDRPPADPIPVPVVPDALPRDPIEVQVSPDSPPAVPFPVPTFPSAPPGSPFPVPTFPDLPALQVRGRSGQPPTISAIVDAVRTFDRTLGSFLDFIVEVDPITATGPGGGSLDPRALARWLADYRSTVGTAGVARFVAEQSVLYAMNPVVSRIFDPTYFFKMLAPGSMGQVRTSVDVEAGVTLSTVAQARDAVLRAAVAANPLRPAGDGLSDRPDEFGPENTVRDGQAFTVDAMVDAAIPGLSQDPGGGEFLRRADGVLRFDANAFFEPRGSDGAQRIRGTTKARAASGGINAFRSKLAASNALDGVIRVTVPGEDEDGAVMSPTQDPSDVVDDDDTRVPLSFTDLRKDPVRNAYHSVYFRPLNLNFSMALGPEWAEGSTFGRVDPTVGYQKTSRTFSVAFEVHAFAPEDLHVMYNKMVLLSSMCYPSFGDDSLFRSGPVVRMRVGDAVSTELGGIPGVIRSLNFNFEDALWELKRGMKVPRSFKVALEFLALHDAPIGVLNGTFGGIQLPPGGTAPDKDTNLAGNPTDSRSNGAPTGVSLLPGRFMRFGEPRR